MKPEDMFSTMFLLYQNIFDNTDVESRSTTILIKNECFDGFILQANEAKEIIFSKLKQNRSSPKKQGDISHKANGIECTPVMLNLMKRRTIEKFKTLEEWLSIKSEKSEFCKKTLEKLRNGLKKNSKESCFEINITYFEDEDEDEDNFDSKEVGYLIEVFNFLPIKAEFNDRKIFTIYEIDEASKCLDWLFNFFLLTKSKSEENISVVSSQIEKVIIDDSINFFKQDLLSEELKSWRDTCLNRIKKNNLCLENGDIPRVPVSIDGNILDVFNIDMKFLLQNEVKLLKKYFEMLYKAVEGENLRKEDFLFSETSYNRLSMESWYSLCVQKIHEGLLCNYSERIAKVPVKYEGFTYDLDLLIKSSLTMQSRGEAGVDWKKVEVYKNYFKNILVTAHPFYQSTFPSSAI